MLGVVARTIAAASALALAAAASIACSGSSSPGVGGSAPAPSGTTPGNGPPGAADDTTPHALGTIVLGEVHASGSSTASPIVSVSFVPDAASAKKCTKSIAGCELAIAPKCAGCKTGEACVLDATCAPKCERTCDVTCDDGEVCKLENAKPVCKKRETFDAGPLGFSGTTTALTLYPPYRYEGEMRGAPFLAGAELRVQAQGAVAAGFEGFDEKFTATRFVQTTPPLDDLPRGTVFGAGPLPIAWVAGDDAIVVSLAGEGGTLSCKGEDKKGKLDVARDAVRAALGGGSTLSVSVARERVETRKDKRTKGTLTGQTVHPVGWLALTTSSAETASFSCSGTECTGATTCDACVASACKAESDACASDAQCPALKSCLDACVDSTCRTGCFTRFPDAGARAKNAALWRCQCTTSCATQCADTCK